MGKNTWGWPPVTPALFKSQLCINFFYIHFLFWNSFYRNVTVVIQRFPLPHTLSPVVNILHYYGMFDTIKEPVEELVHYN